MNTRRQFLKLSAATIFAATSSSLLNGCTKKNSVETITVDPPLKTSRINEIGSLLPPDKNGLMLPEGFTSRIVASSGFSPSTNSSYIWHDAPDGGATFGTSDGGWIYVSNSELGNNLGKVGAIRFDSSGNIVDSYSILERSNRNCAGGATPWGSWLSCEEYQRGVVWECDPNGINIARKLPALGVFSHEAIALDYWNNHIYLTEDTPDSCLYRFIPSNTLNGIPDLSEGVLEVAIVENSESVIEWVTIPDPSALSQPTRYQVPNSTKFNGGEGIVFHEGVVSFATKGDNRIWSYDVLTQKISVIYDINTHPNPTLSGVDNLTITQDGELVVSEDGGNLQIVAITENNELIPLVQAIGHNASELTGPAFSPDGKRFYFSSQRGVTGLSRDGITFEILGPYHK